MDGTLPVECGWTTINPQTIVDGKLEEHALVSQEASFTMQQTIQETENCERLGDHEQNEETHGTSCIVKEKQGHQEEASSSLFHGNGVLNAMWNFKMDML